MIDRARLKRFINEIIKNSNELKQLVKENTLTPNSLALKAAKYLLIELAEAISNLIQHILAKEKGIIVSGYIDTIVKAYENNLISKELYNKLRPFFDFRNSLIHRYWQVDDELLIKNIIKGKDDLEQFVREIEGIINGS